MKIVNKITASLIASLVMVSTNINIAEAKKPSVVKKEHKSESKLKLDYEKITLPNGLDVIFHVDKSDPIVTTAILYHVGSGREEKGKTGFAHLFEHMLFQESENVGQDQYFKKIQGAGGTLNGYTWTDGTMYFESVPKDALELILWMESDRMGYFINTLTQEAFENQQDVVQNEKRQNYDNKPYGNIYYVISKLLYPENHPYNWLTIGSMEDIKNASLTDVKNFYKKFYMPNNATLVVSGDFEIKQAKKLVQKYFGEIKSGKKPPELKVKDFELKETKKAYYEDALATAPYLSLSWKGVPLSNKEKVALDFLSGILGRDQKSPLYKLIVDEKKLSSGTSVGNDSNEYAGSFGISIKGFSETSLDDVEKAIFESLARFEKEGISDGDLDSLKSKYEKAFYNKFSTIIGKAINFADDNTFSKNPKHYQDEIKEIMSVKKEDIINVYNKYIKNKNYVSVSFVPKGKANLAVKDAKVFTIKEEAIANTEEKKKKEVAKVKIAKTPSSFDRSKEPALGEKPLLKLPQLWNYDSKNGIKVFGTKQSELPLINFSIKLDGGMLLDRSDKIGTANLLAQLLREGTKNRTPAQLEEELESLGADLSISAGKEGITINVSTLERTYEKTLALVEDVLLNPNWDDKAFEKLKKKVLTSIKDEKSNPDRVAVNVMLKLVYGNSVLANQAVGNYETVERITLDDLMNYYHHNLSPSLARFNIAGDISKDRVVKSLKSLESNWKNHKVDLPEIVLPKFAEKPQLYFVDVPKAKQSVIYLTHPGLSRKDPDYFKAQLMNTYLGGSFSSLLNNILREEKGYTYGARAYFSGGKYAGIFYASAGVKSSTTQDSVKIFKETVSNYYNLINQKELDIVKNSQIKSNARKFEGLGALTAYLDEIGTYNLSPDYVKQEENIAQNITLDEVKGLIKKHIKPESLIYLVVGDAETQLEPLKTLGLGDPIMLNKDGEVIK